MGLRGRNILDVSVVSLCGTWGEIIGTGKGGRCCKVLVLLEKGVGAGKVGAGCGRYTGGGGRVKETVVGKVICDVNDMLLLLLFEAKVAWIVVLLLLVVTTFLLIGRYIGAGGGDIAETGS